MKIIDIPNIDSMLMVNRVTNVVKDLGKSLSNWWWLKNLRPDNPIQSENIMHKNDSIAIDMV